MTNIIFYSLEPDELKQLISDAVLQAVDKPNPQQPDQEDQLIKIEEASKLLNVSKATVHAWKKSGLIPFHRISSKIYFKKNEILDSLKSIKKRDKDE